MGEVVRVVRLPIRAGEHVTDFQPWPAGDQVGGSLAAQDGGGPPVEGDGAAASRGFGWAFDYLVADAHIPRMARRAVLRLYSSATRVDSRRAHLVGRGSARNRWLSATLPAAAGRCAIMTSGATAARRGAESCGDRVARRASCFRLLRVGVPDVPGRR